MKQITIVVTKRSDYYHACVEGISGMWGHGQSPHSAVGDLVFTWRDKFGIQIETRSSIDQPPLSKART